MDINPAYEHNGQPCTREAFYAIACDPRRSVAVEACAGAGKTWMLVSRILRALLNGAEPQEILAITFTKKAAGEMRQRLQQWLSEFASARPDETPSAWQARLTKELVIRGISPQSATDLRDTLQKLYPALLAYGRTVQIRTFHSWFAALLRSAPLQVLQDLGLPSSYELLEDDQDAVAEVWRRYLGQVARDEALREDYAALVRALGRSRAHAALEAALARRVEFALADAAGHVDEAVPTFDAYYPRMAGVAAPADWLMQREAGQALLSAAAEALLPGARTFAECGTRLKAALAAGDWPAVQDALLTQKGEPRKFSDKLAGIADVRAAQQELAALLAAERQHSAREHHLRMARLTRPLIAAFSQLKRERGWVDMTDVERAALTLLSDPFLCGWVQERLDARVRHLLIDEFQDTNPLQWQALHAWLQGYAGAGGGQTPPSVFIVGDPKQSIYRFRRADPRVFTAAQSFVVNALGGDRLACDHTHRNAPAVLGAVNQVMLQAQQADQFSGYRAHTTQSALVGAVDALPLIPRPDKASADDDADDDGAPAWRDSLTTPRVALEEKLNMLEARQAAQWIAARVAAGCAPQDLMVLARRRAPLGLLQAELRQLGIPCEQPEQQVLGDLPVVQDVLALVDALVSPGNDLALARALKSPLFRLDDEALIRIALAVRAERAAPHRDAAGDAAGVVAGATANATQSAPECAPESATAAPRHAAPSWLDVLAKMQLPAPDGRALHADLMLYQRWLLTLPPHDALQAIYTHRDALARFAAAAPPAERDHSLAQLRALLGAALQVQGGRFLTAYQWVRALRRQRLTAPRHAAPEAVQLLTVHGAKGLEAEEVLLVDTASGLRSRGEASALIDWPGDAAAPTCFVFLANGNAPPPSAAELADQEAAAQAREELNALYVAMTRARQRLVLSGITPHRAPASSWWQRIAPLASPLDAPSAAPTPVHTPGDQAQFHMLDLPPAPDLRAPEAIESEALKAWQADAVLAAPTEASRLGEAMHWLLENTADSPAGWRPERLTQARERFGLSAEHTARADALARRIFTGEAAWAWSADELMEAFNEVELTYQGQRLRIDRLVRRRASASEPEAWWVLDYKSAAHPERDPLLQAQMARYRAAVELLHPGHTVRVAFLTGEGRLIG
ncbi:MAG: UvrD-helicase domain-containing protein [Ottowia sp.]|nr:UvrD-helicase domain-containing protein [Ottowia sp.]